MSRFDGCLNQNQVRMRYHDLCMEHHPDRATIIMQEINAEYARFKAMTDAELQQQAQPLDDAVSHLPKVKPAEAACQARPAPRVVRVELYYPPAQPVETRDEMFMREWCDKGLGDIDYGMG